jgi:hypothetical protein
MNHFVILTTLFLGCATVKTERVEHKPVVRLVGNQLTSFACVDGVVDIALARVSAEGLARHDALVVICPSGNGQAQNSRVLSTVISGTRLCVDVETEIGSIICR